MTENGSLSLTHRFSAPVEHLFKAWIDPRLLVQWGVTRAQTEPRLNGAYRFETEGPETSLHIVSGRYLEFIPDQHLVKSWIYEGPGFREKVESRVSVDFRALGPDASELTLTESGPTLKDDEARSSGIAAWESVFGLLESLLAKTPA